MKTQNLLAKLSRFAAALSCGIAIFGLQAFARAQAGHWVAPWETSVALRIAEGEPMPKSWDDLPKKEQGVKVLNKAGTTTTVTYELVPPAGYVIPADKVQQTTATTTTTTSSSSAPVEFEYRTPAPIAAQHTVTTTHTETVVEDVTMSLAPQPAGPITGEAYLTKVIVPPGLDKNAIEACLQKALKGRKYKIVTAGDGGLVATYKGSKSTEAIKLTADYTEASVLLRASNLEYNPDKPLNPWPTGWVDNVTKDLVSYLNKYKPSDK